MSYVRFICHSHTSSWIFDPLKGPTFRRCEFTREAVCEFPVEGEPVHYLSAVVFGEVVRQVDRQNASRLLCMDNVVRPALKTTVTERRGKRAWLWTRILAS